MNLIKKKREGKKIYRSCDIELNKIVEVKYGSGKTTYHAKIVQINEENQTMLVHYLGWNNRYFILFSFPANCSKIITNIIKISINYFFILIT